MTFFTYSIFSTLVIVTAVDQVDRPLETDGQTNGGGEMVNSVN